MDTSIVAEWLRVKQLAEARKVEHDALNQEAIRLQEQVMEELISDGVDRITIEGRTVSIKKRVVANKNPDVDVETFHEALREAGLGDYIKPAVSASALAGYARELRDNGEALPEPLQAVLNVHELQSLGHSASSSTPRGKRG